MKVQFLFRRIQLEKKKKMTTKKDIFYRKTKVHFVINVVFYYIGIFIHVRF